MKAKKHGTAVIFFDTDLEKSTPFDEGSLSDLQKRTLSEMPKAEQEKIKAGYGARVIDIGSGGLHLRLQHQRILTAGTCH